MQRIFSLLQHLWIWIDLVAFPCLIFLKKIKWVVKDVIAKIYVSYTRTLYNIVIILHAAPIV
jgi:hypothetical protein